VAEPFGQVRPGGAGAGDPQDGVQEAAVILGHTAVLAGLARQQVLDDEATLQALRADQPDLSSRLLAGDERQVAHVARNNESGVVRTMLKAGQPVDARGQHNATPLHWAAFHGNLEMVQAILPYGPPLEVTDADFHGTPLGWAVHGSKEGWYRQTGDYARPSRLC
jgi:hypothetical protein